MIITSRFLENLALEAGIIIRNGFNQLSKTDSLWKEDDTPVTEADTTVNNLVLETFREHYPQVSVIAEEGSNEFESDWLVYCDPIDGTFPYATGMPISTFCLSVLHKGVPQQAVIYDPFNNRMYTAEKGKGAFMNGNLLKVSDHKALSIKTHIHLIWWKSAQFNLDRLCHKLVMGGVPWMNYCTVGILGGLIASGQFEVSVFPGNKLWETAAMGLIVEEAGGKCTDMFGQPIDYLRNGEMKGHLITNGFLHDEMVQVIKESL
jgi:myo-inositol-1(or 4)-monophosphatase